MAGKKAKPKKAAKRPDFEKLKPAAVLCPICRTILIEPVTLPCDHVFCKQCFEGTMENANLVCPLCRLRVGSWFRRVKKEGKLVDKEFWRAIQQQYPVEVANKQQGIDNDIEEDQPVIIVANPGEIRKEYEKERQKDLEEQNRIREAEERASAALIKKIREEEEYKKQVEEEKLRLDALLAKKLSEELTTPSTSNTTPRKPAKSENSKKYGPMDRFIKTDDAISSRRLSHKRTDLHRTHPVKSSKSALSGSPNNIISKQYLGKEYTCHVLPVEQCSMRINRSNNLFADLDFKGIFGTLGQKPTKTTDPDRRKSICTSGYKSSGSGDNSDVIDQECKFYFKPIDPQRRHHVHGKIPLRIPTVLGINEGDIPIEPPSGKTQDLYSSESAFVRFSASTRASSRDEIEGEATPDLPFKHLKRKASIKSGSPLRKKGKRQVFAFKKNLILKPASQSVSSPFYGFDNASKRVVNNSPFYGFDTLHIEESLRERDAVIKQISRYERKVAGPFGLSPERLASSKHQESDIDINRNIPKPSSRFNNLNNIRISLDSSSRSVKILRTALRNGPKLTTSPTNLELHPATTSFTCPIVGDNGGTKESQSRLVSQYPASFMNGYVKNKDGRPLNSSVENSIPVNHIGTPPNVFDSDSEDEVLSKMIDKICNSSQGDDGTKATSPPSSCVLNAANFANKRKKGSPKKSPKKTVTENVEPDSTSQTLKIVDQKLSKVCRPNRRNSKITDTFSKAKNSPPKVKISPQKTRSNAESLQVNGEADVEQKKLQEEADFEFAKKLQAEFNLIGVSSRTRRGTKRQITLEEMLSV